MLCQWPPSAVLMFQVALYLASPSGVLMVPSQRQLPADFLITSFSGATGGGVGGVGAAAFSGLAASAALAGSALARTWDEAVSTANAAITAIWSLMHASVSVVGVSRRDRIQIGRAS